MKVLVTGANGFIGSALCPYLGALGYEVVPAVRRPYGAVNEQVVDDEASWQAALVGCDSVIHLAGRAHGTSKQERDGLPAFRAVNVAATVELANRAVAAGVKRFVFMSTIKVNGEETAANCRFKPDDLPAPQDPYAISKWEAEQKLLEIAKKTGLEVVIIRPPLVYGPGVKGNFASLIRWATSGVPLPLGAICNRRSMVGLMNLMSLTALCADMRVSPKAKDQIFLVSDQEDISTSELLRRVARAYGSASRLLPVPAGLMRCILQFMGKASLADRLLGSLAVDNSKAQAMLGWQPLISMDEQLREMAEHDARI